MLLAFLWRPSIKGPLPHVQPSWELSPPSRSYLYAQPWTSSGGLPIKRWTLDGTGLFNLPTTGLKLPNNQARALMNAYRVVFILSFRR
jgi:hypothetical protein